MNTTILRSNSCGTLSAEALESFERELGVPLPEEYRAFLLQHNGGTPQPACFLAPEDPFDEDDSSLSEREVICFFALHHNPWSDKTMEESLAHPLQEARRDYLNMQAQSNLLPIGKDWSGNYICIGLKGDDQGSVFFYDHEYEVETRLADSFTQFLAQLQPCTPNE